MTDTKKDPPPLGSTGRDTGVALIKGAVGMVPMAGSMLAEIVSVLIPEQRVERLEAYVRHLNDRLNDIDADELKRLASKPEAIDLFEDGAHQAAKALSDERRQRIAELVASGIKGDEAAQLESKRLLTLLNEVDDAQLIILSSHSHTHSRSQEFYERNAAVLEPVRAHLGSSQDELDKDTMFRLNRDHLIRLGLLRPRFQQPRRGEMPEFDRDTGMMKTSGRELTPLGRLLLRRIGLLGPDQH